MAILAENNITPTHDTTDAVNYFTFNGNQWVSYDDAVTFQQKVTWANSVGLGGGMIWASDLGMLTGSCSCVPEMYYS
jgi:chitinase